MRKQFDLTRMMEIFRQIIEKIELSCDETLIKKTLDGKCLVCLSEGLCWEFLGRLGGWRSSQKSWAVWAYNQAMGQRTDLVTWWDQIERVRLWSGGPCVRSFKTPLVTVDLLLIKKQCTSKRMEGLVFTVVNESAHWFSIHRIKFHWPALAQRIPLF